jgi:hypothetical protein
MGGKHSHYNKETKTLTFNQKFNEKIQNLSEGIEKIIFLENLLKISIFNQPLDNLPNSLIDLYLGFAFSYPVDNLPNGLKYLRLGHAFNHPIDNLPINLTHLIFCHQSIFNHPVDKLPNSLTHLHFGFHFNQPINNLPINLIRLTLNNSFTYPVINLPITVKEIILVYRQTGSFVKKIPFGCKVYNFKIDEKNIVNV